MQIAGSPILASQIGRNLNGKSSGPCLSHPYQSVLLTFRICSIDPTQKDLDLADHLRTHFEPLLLDSTPRSAITGTANDSSPIAQVDITAPSRPQLETVANKSKPQPTGAAGADDGLILMRPPTQRLNSIYTYLKKPARFSWPTPYANPDSGKLAAQEPTKADENLSSVAVPAAETPQLPAIQPDASNRILGVRTTVFFLVTAVMFFLLGSLVRSLLGEHQDFFTILPRNSSIIEPEWQEMTRVVEIKIYKWHVVLALLRDRMA